MSNIKKVVDFFKHTYWGMPRTIFKGWTFLIVYLIPAIYISFWLLSEKYRLDAPPKFDELMLITGTAEFAQSRYKSLLVRRDDKSLYLPVCRPLQMGATAGCANTEEIAATKVGKVARVWVHPIAGAMQVEIDGVTREGFDFKSLKSRAMDNSDLDFKKLMTKLYAFVMLVLLPTVSVRKILLLKRK